MSTHTHASQCDVTTMSTPNLISSIIANEMPKCDCQRRKMREARSTRASLSSRIMRTMRRYDAAPPAATSLPASYAAMITSTGMAVVTSSGNQLER